MHDVDAVGERPKPLEESRPQHKAEYTALQNENVQGQRKHKRRRDAGRIVAGEGDEQANEDDG
ncbi:MAG: hypothetical protein RLN70_04565, partial [Rhodospirillaceae bacterium]